MDVAAESGLVLSAWVAEKEAGTSFEMTHELRRNFSHHYSRPVQLGKVLLPPLLCSSPSCHCPPTWTRWIQSELAVLVLQLEEAVALLPLVQVAVVKVEKQP